MSPTPSSAMNSGRNGNTNPNAVNIKKAATVSAYRFRCQDHTIIREAAWAADAARGAGASFFVAGDLARLARPAVHVVDEPEHSFKDVRWRKHQRDRLKNASIANSSGQSSRSVMRHDAAGP